MVMGVKYFRPCYRPLYYILALSFQAWARVIAPLMQRVRYGMRMGQRTKSLLWPGVKWRMHENAGSDRRAVASSLARKKNKTYQLGLKPAKRAFLIRLQARAARFFNKFSSGWALPGLARPIYINRHPQPPAKSIGFSGICQDNYFTYPQIILLTAASYMGYTGTMFNLTKGVLWELIEKKT